jgi:hypothetical protein
MNTDKRSSTVNSNNKGMFYLKGDLFALTKNLPLPALLSTLKRYGSTPLSEKNVAVLCCRRYGIDCNGVTMKLLLRLK